MASCKECIHYNVCGYRIDEETTMIITECSHFKNTADVVEVKHGKWLDFYKNKYANHLYVCSLCGERALFEYYANELGQIEIRQKLTSVCPNCGAKMDGKEKQDAN